MGMKDEFGGIRVRDYAEARDLVAWRAWRAGGLEPTQRVNESLER